MELTTERLACLRAVESVGGRVCHEEEIIAPFCDDASTMTKPDVFNQCHDAGWLVSGYDDRTDTSTAHLTKEGYAVLRAAPRTQGTEN